MPKHDPFRWTDVLRKIAQSSVAEFLRKGNSTNDSDSAVAYLWTETVGKCLLNGIKVEGSYQINSQVALLAFVCGKSFVRDSIRDLEEIEEDIATSDTQLEIDEYVCSPLEERMDYWAVTIAAEAAIRENPADKASKALLEFIGIVEEFDEGLETKIEDICLAANTNLLSNWTASLDSKYTDPLPWWLDGRLEKQLRQLGREAAPLRCGLSTMVRAFSLVDVKEKSSGKVAYEIESEITMAASQEVQRVTCGELCWVHPDGATIAKIQKPRKLLAEGKSKKSKSKTSVCLKLSGQDGAASHLIGKVAEFGEVSATIGKTSKAGVEAEFVYEDLIQQVEAGNHDLIIEGVRWLFLGND